MSGKECKHSSPLTVPLVSLSSTLASHDDGRIDEIDVDGDGGDDQTQDEDEERQNHEENLGAEILSTAAFDSVIVIVIVVVVLFVISAATTATPACTAADVD